MADKRKKNSEHGKRKPYRKPAIIFEEKIELLASACGGFQDQKSGIGQINPLYLTTTCFEVFS